MINRVSVDASGKEKPFIINASKYTQTSNYFEFGKPVESTPHSSLF